MVGDEPFEILSDATRKIADRYREHLGRPPTRDEWQHLLLDSLLPDLAASGERSLFHEGGAPTRIEIQLKK